MQLMLGLLLAMSITMALIPLLISQAGRWHILDEPSPRKVHASPVPRVGGIAIALGMLVAVAMMAERASPMPAFLGGALVLLIFGVWDDRATLGPGAKLFGQAIAVLLVMVFGDVLIGSVTLDARIVLPSWIAVPLTFVFLLGVTNAVNFVDGLDGLAGGTVLLSLGAIGLLAFAVGNAFVAPVAVIGVGAVLGFLRYNTHPARVFMGDSGSQLLGFATGVLAVVVTQGTASPLSAALPLLLLGVPIVDTLLAIARRIAGGRSPFQADRSHIHHRLLAFGFAHRQAVGVIYAAQAVLFVIAWYMRFESDIAIALVFVAFASGVALILEGARIAGWRFAAAFNEWPLRSIGKAMPLEGTTASRVLDGAIAGLLVLHVALPIPRLPDSSLDVRLLVAGLGAVCLFDLIARHRQAEASWVAKGVWYLTAIVLAYLGHRASGHSEPVDACLLGALACVVALCFVMPGRASSLTPLDLLIMFAAVAAPLTLASINAGPEATFTVVSLLVILYAIEALTPRLGHQWRYVSASALALLVLSVA